MSATQPGICTGGQEPPARGPGPLTGRTPCWCSHLSHTLPVCPVCLCNCCCCKQNWRCWCTGSRCSHITTTTTNNNNSDHAPSPPRPPAPAAAPAAAAGLRGAAALEVTVTTAGSDMHSGMVGGSVQNANHALLQLLSGLWDRGSKAGSLLGLGSSKVIVGGCGLDGAAGGPRGCSTSTSLRV